MCNGLGLYALCLFIFPTKAYRLRTKHNFFNAPFHTRELCKKLCDTLGLRLTCLVCKFVTFTILVDIDGRMRLTMTTADRPIWQRRILLWSYCCNVYLGICFLCKIIVSTRIRDESIQKPYNTMQAP